MRYFGPYGHFGHHGHHGAWPWVLGGITMLLLWLVLVTVLVLLWRVLTHRTGPTALWHGGGTTAGPGAPGGETAARSAAEQVLAERLARGEIEVEEYRQRLAALRGGPDSGP